MNALVRCKNLTHAFGDRPVLDRADLVIDAQERLAVVGRNGEGKSTLLKLLAGELSPDAGTIERRDALKTAYLPQAIPSDLPGSAYAVVASGMPDVGQLLSEYHAASLALEHDPRVGGRLSRLQDALDARDGWNVGARIDELLSRLDLPADARFDTLSGGLKRRVLLARALVDTPDILLLDEPTNHLDIDAIRQLETQLPTLARTIVLITHDRAFLDRVATRIVELDRGRLTSWPGDFAVYRRERDRQLEAEATEQAAFDKRLAQEEVWIRKGIQARRTRNEGRVRRLEAMREAARAQRKQSGTVTLDAQFAGRSGKLVVEAERVGKRYADRQVVRDLSITLLREDRLGVIGPNGSGKTTLVRLLLGETEPDSGTIRHGSRLEVAYFDQLRAALDPTKSAADNVGGGADQIEVNGRQTHILSYLQDFLFAPARARAPITALSGGETSRLLLARLFLKPSNVLVFDEPSNDLDIETLELLEALLADYPGTIILISHDRMLLDRVVTRSLVYTEDGRFEEVSGGYADMERELGSSAPWRRDSRSAAGSSAPSAKPAGNGAGATSKRDPATAAGRAAKLSYRDQRELDALPERIETLETELEALQTAMCDPAHASDAQALQRLAADAGAKQLELDAAYARWETLDGMSDTG